MDGETPVPLSTEDDNVNFKHMQGNIHGKFNHHIATHYKTISSIPVPTSVRD